MQWYQLDHMQTICTSFQTDNHTNTSSLNFYRPDALQDTHPTVSKYCRQTLTAVNNKQWHYITYLNQCSNEFVCTLNIYFHHFQTNRKILTRKNATELKACQQCFFMQNTSASVYRLCTWFTMMSLDWCICPVICEILQNTILSLHLNFTIFLCIKLPSF